MGPRRTQMLLPAVGTLRKPKWFKKKKSYTAALPTPDSLEAPFQATLNTGRAEKSTTLKAACRGRPCSLPHGGLTAGTTSYTALGHPPKPPQSRPVLLLHNCWEPLQESHSSGGQKQSSLLSLLQWELRSCKWEAPHPSSLWYHR